MPCLSNNRLICVYVHTTNLHCNGNALLLCLHVDDSQGTTKFYRILDDDKIYMGPSSDQIPQYTRIYRQTSNNPPPKSKINHSLATRNNQTSCNFSSNKSILFLYLFCACPHPYINNLLHCSIDISRYIDFSKIYL